MHSDATADWAAEDETLAMVMDELGLEVAGTMSAVPNTQAAAAARSQSQPAAAQLGVADFFSDETAETVEAERAAAERAALAQQLHSLHETLAEMINAAEMRAADERAADERAADEDLKKLAAEEADRRLKRLTDLAERGAREHVADRMPIRSFFNAAQTMLQQARTLAVEQDLEHLERAYVLLIRFSTLFVEVLPTHAGFRSAEVAADRRALIEEVSIVLEEAAHVKNVLRSRYLRAEVEVQQQAAAEEARIRAEVEVRKQAAAEAQAAANAAAEAAAANAARAAAAAAEARRVAEAEANSAAAASAALASAAIACANRALARLAECLRFSKSSTATSAAATSAASAASAASWSTRDGWLL